MLKHAKFTQKIIQKSIVNAMPVSSFVATKVFCCQYYRPQIGDSHIQPDYNSISFSRSGSWKLCPDAQLVFSRDLNGQVVHWGKSDRKEIHWKKILIQNFSAIFLKDSISCYTSLWFSRVKTVSYISLIFRLVRLWKDFGQFPFLQNQKHLKLQWIMESKTWVIASK